MGQIEQRLGVSNGNGGEERSVVALVDTGATYSVLPDSLLRDELGITPLRHEDFSYPDGSIVRLPIGEASLRVGDRRHMNVVVFGAEDQYLLGATTLQVLGLIPDTTHHALIPAPKLRI